MEILAELAGNPERCVPSIHVAGSKGKGSVTAMIASILEADGKRAARYMSPHIHDFRERICMGNGFFDEAVYCAAGDALRDVAEQKVPALNSSLFDPASEEGEALTFFELLTLFFFLCARMGNCDVMVVETGMGGRLDCTNIVDPLVSVITFIELEHTAILGDTIPAIAGEKAGIIKAGRPLVLARQNAQALDVFKKRTAEKNSPLLYFPDIAAIKDVRVYSGGTDFSLLFPAQSPTSTMNLSIPIPGKVQVENAGLAVAALKTAFPGIANNADIGNDTGIGDDAGIGDAAIRQGLACVQLPARFEKVSYTPPFIIDGAHTPESAALCVETFCSLYGEGGILLFGCAADKNAPAMAEILQPWFSQVIVTTPGTFKISDPEKAYRAFSAANTLFIQDTHAAIQQALDAGREKQLPILSVGSFYLAAEVRAYFAK